MIRGDSSDYDLLEKWTKGFDCQGLKRVRLVFEKDWELKLLWIMLLITIYTWVSILTGI